MELTLGLPERCWVEAVARFAFWYESFFHEYRQTSSNLKEELCVASSFSSFDCRFESNCQFLFSSSGISVPKIILHSSRIKRWVSKSSDCSLAVSPFCKLLRDKDKLIFSNYCFLVLMNSDSVRRILFFQTIVVKNLGSIVNNWIEWYTLLQSWEWFSRSWLQDWLDSLCLWHLLILPKWQQLEIHCPGRRTKCNHWSLDVATDRYAA